MDVPSEADLLAFLDAELNAEQLLAGFAGVSVERVTSVPKGPDVHHLGDIRLARELTEPELLPMTSIAEVFHHPEVGRDVGVLVVRDFANSESVLVTRPEDLLRNMSASDMAVVYDLGWASDVELRDRRHYRALALTVSFVPTSALNGEAVRFSRARGKTRIVLCCTAGVQRVGPRIDHLAHIGAYRLGEQAVPCGRITTV
jgi:hypothetical protein